MTSNQVPLTATAAQILPANPARYVAFVTFSAPCFIGPIGVTAETGFAVQANFNYPIESTQALYGLTASGTATAYYLDEYGVGYPTLFVQ